MEGPAALHAACGLRVRVVIVVDVFFVLMLPGKKCQILCVMVHTTSKQKESPRYNINVVQELPCSLLNVSVGGSKRTPPKAKQYFFVIDSAR